MTTPKEHEVSGCRDCQFLYDSIGCAHPGWPPDADFDEHDVALGDAHPSCPLREGPITVRLRK